MNYLLQIFFSHFPTFSENQFFLLLLQLRLVSEKLVKQHKGGNLHWKEQKKEREREGSLPINYQWKMRCLKINGPDENRTSNDITHTPLKFFNSLLNKEKNRFNLQFQFICFIFILWLIDLDAFQNVISND